MGTSSRVPAKLNREELEAEVTRLRELEERVEALEALVGTLGDPSPEEAVMKHVTLASGPPGKMLQKNHERIK